MMLYADKMLTAVFLKILKMSVTAGCCILAVLLIRWVFHRAPRRYLYMLWTVAAFRLICPVSISTEFSLFNLDVWAERTPVQTEYAAEDPAGSPGEREILSPEGEVQRETSEGVDSAGKCPGSPGRKGAVRRRKHAGYRLLAFAHRGIYLGDRHTGVSCVFCGWYGRTAAQSPKSGPDLSGRTVCGRREGQVPDL